MVEVRTQNAAALFHVVNECVGPVMLIGQAGERRDLRHDRFLQQVLMQQKPLRLRMEVKDPRDTASLMRQMLNDR